MPTDTISATFVAFGQAVDYTAASIAAFGEIAREVKANVWRGKLWMWLHRSEPNNRSKRRRFGREIYG